MRKNKAETGTDYGNWISWRLIAAAAVGSGLFFVPVPILDRGFLGWISLTIALLFAASTLYLLLARISFSKNRGELQSRIRGLVLANLEWNGQGKVLDIGCGNGPLSIELARKYPESRVTGVDYWGAKWEHSRETCRDNARAEGVSGQVVFERADAASLPFADGSFEAAVSNMVFHEVKKAKDKREVLKEALRVVKKGGAFAFQDLFSVKRIYGDLESLMAELKEYGVEEVRFEDSGRSEFIPAFLRRPFMFGWIGIIHGRR